MCDLATAMAVIGAAGSFAQYQGQRQMANQQARYQAQASAAERARFLQEQTLNNGWETGPGPGSREH